MFLAFANGYVMAGGNTYFDKQQNESLKILDPSIPPVNREKQEKEVGANNYTFLLLK